MTTLTEEQLESIAKKQHKAAKAFVKYDSLYNLEVNLNAVKNKESSAKQEKYYDKAAVAFAELSKRTRKVLGHYIDTIGY
jgi:hypothetical protein